MTTSIIRLTRRHDQTDFTAQLPNTGMMAAAESDVLVSIAPDKHIRYAGQYGKLKNIKLFPIVLHNTDLMLVHTTQHNVHTETQ